jgi:hypothetical protein
VERRFEFSCPCGVVGMGTLEELFWRVKAALVEMPLSSELA